MQHPYMTTDQKTAVAIRRAFQAKSVCLVGIDGTGKRTLTETFLMQNVHVVTATYPEDLREHTDNVIELPLLRNTPDDIDLICTQELGTRIHPNSIQELRSWNWAGERDELVSLLRAVKTITDAPVIPHHVFVECRELRPILLKVLPLTHDIYRFSREFGLAETMSAIQRVTQVLAVTRAGGRLNRAAAELRFPYHKFYYELQKAPDIWKRLSQEWEALQQKAL